jgi:toxin ParE1/3/4
MKITVLPAAEANLTEAASFYASNGSAVLAAKFVADFKRVAQVLLEFGGHRFAQNTRKARPPT